jgi:hypothetical protein
MKMKKALSTCFILALFLGGCAPWIMVGGNYENSAQNFKAEFPNGWRKFNLSKDNVLITKDGLSLQFIRISRSPIEKELQHTEKKFTKGMLPQEVAEIVIQNFRSNSDIMNQQVLANNPAEIGGYPGFNIVFTFQTKEGLTKQSIVYGFLSSDSYYEILYEAPKRYYFTKDESDFEKVKDTFKLLRDNV